MPETSITALLAGTFLLGIRHGIDWDHIAAILDFVGSSPQRSAVRQDPIWKSPNSGLIASIVYALGHGLIVILLGISALSFSAILPEWIDPLMEKAVGLSLLLLAAWVLLCTIRSSFRNEGSDKKERFISRGALLLQVLSKFCQDPAKSSRGSSADSEENVNTSAKAALAVGALHGIGAETGTQVLLLTAVAGTSQLKGAAMLLSFVLGLLACNFAVALAGACGFTLAKNKAASYFMGITSALLSIYVGSCLCLGEPGCLPDLQKILFNGH